MHILNAFVAEFHLSIILHYNGKLDSHSWFVQKENSESKVLSEILVTESKEIIQYYNPANMLPDDFASGK